METNQTPNLQKFIEQSCQVSAEALTNKRDFYDAYLVWQRQESEQEKPLSMNAVSNEMGRLGFTEKRTKTTRLWRGIHVSDAEVVVEQEVLPVEAPVLEISIPLIEPQTTLPSIKPLQPPHNDGLFSDNANFLLLRAMGL